VAGGSIKEEEGDRKLAICYVLRRYTGHNTCKYSIVFLQKLLLSGFDHLII
jgi:hypothetical protein